MAPRLHHTRRRAFRGDGGHFFTLKRAPFTLCRSHPRKCRLCVENPSPVPMEREAGRSGLKGWWLLRPPGQASGSWAWRSSRRRVPASPGPPHPLGTQCQPLGSWGPRPAHPHWPRCWAAAPPKPREGPWGHAAAGSWPGSPRTTFLIQSGRVPGGYTGQRPQGPPPSAQAVRKPVLMSGADGSCPPPAWGPPAAPGQGDGFELVGGKGVSARSPTLQPVEHTVRLQECPSMCPPSGRRGTGRPACPQHGRSSRLPAGCVPVCPLTAEGFKPSRRSAGHPWRAREGTPVR